MNAEIVPATVSHISLILEHCREKEKEAYARIGGDFLRQLIENGAEAWCGFYDGKLICMWTISRGSMVSNSASVWITTADGIEDHPFVFARHSQIRLAELKKKFSYIHGYVLADNRSSIKWLRWLGFTVGPLEFINGYLIRHFGMACDVGS